MAGIPSSREKILDVAEALFARRGYSGVGLREVASQVGLGKSSLFHHFRSKTQLYGEVLDRVLHRIGERLDPVLRSDDDPVRRLERSIGALVDALAEVPTTARLLLRALFEALDLPTGLAQMATQGKEEPVKELQKAISELVNRLLTAGTDLQSRLSFWGQPLLRDDELTDWHQRLAALKTFLESLQPYNTVGKLKNLRVTQADVDTQKKNLGVLAQVERLRDLVADLGTTAAYLSQAEMVLESGHPWTQNAQAARKEILDKLAQDRTAQHAAEYRRRLAALKKDYVAAYVASHAKARLGVSEDRTKSALRKDPRLVTLRALAAISLMPTGQLTTFEDKLDKLKSCAALIESELAASPVCPHCNFRPANEQGDMLPAANVLKGLDDELDDLLTAWQQTLLDNLDDPITQANFDLLRAGQRDQIQGFLAKRTLPDSATPGFISAVQEALSGLEKIIVSADDIKQALLSGGSPAAPEELRKRFEVFLNERCKGKDTSKLRFVVE